MMLGGKDTPSIMHLVFRRNLIATRGVVLVWAALASSAFSQNSDVRVSITPRIPTQLDARTLRSGIIQTDVNRVFIPTMVTDSSGRPVQGLRKEDFRLLEDGVEQDLSDFFIEDGPISIGVVFDISGSIKSKLSEAQRAISEFLRFSGNGDEYFLVTFKDQPKLAHAFTTDPREIEADVAVVQPSGWTALYDAMFLAIHHMKQASLKRRVLLVLSDGGDNNSRYSEREIKNLVREADVRIFTISIQSHTPALEKLAAESGGHAYQVNKLDELPAVASALSAEAHGAYVLGFSPPERQRGGKYHVIKVELLESVGSPRLHVSWRHGYFDPLE